MAKANLQNSAKTNNSTFCWTLKGRWQWRPVAANALPIIAVAPQMHSANLFQFPQRWACCPSSSLPLRTSLRAARNHHTRLRRRSRIACATEAGSRLRAADVIGSGSASPIFRVQSQTDGKRYRKESKDPWRNASLPGNACALATVVRHDRTGAHSRRVPRRISYGYARDGRCRARRSTIPPLQQSLNACPTR